MGSRYKFPQNVSKNFYRYRIQIRYFTVCTRAQNLYMKLSKIMSFSRLKRLAVNELRDEFILILTINFYRSGIVSKFNKSRAGEEQGGDQ